MTTLQEILAGPGGAPEAPEGPRPQAGGRRAARLLRPSRGPAGAVVALAAAVVLSALAAGTVTLLSGSSSALAVYGRLAAGPGALSWSDPVVLGAALGVVAVGAALVAVAVVPGRPRLVPLETGDPLAVIGLTRSGLRRTLRAAAESVDGVGRARVRLGRGGVEVLVVAETDGTGRLLRRVGAEVGDRLAALGAVCGDEVVVRLRGRGIG
ncbi:DUF6286 domain-containing protein [Planomonospora parontospora]|uniref:DUF6286 domain-containing protein n=1 Tax=Planomonospora parontospora TaxID=58119 RepID=UPI001670EA98|nr:DUF6286 domain-containing protein [Planomonospora parontospora]GGL35507.1 hypothetical protein GCM10014719_40840 [Planomonospora parontospora subsp. antibiotica]GII17476.1 hypothetical protein Ppa05_42020 [Planomonospora parontospora subsp. antibiotica]